MMSRWTKAGIILTGSPAALLGHMIGDKLMQEAARVDRARRHGLMVGLTADEASHVIEVWRAYYRSRPDGIEWGRVEAAMAARALGLDWRPHE